jgi:hypothetical protein
MMMANQSEESEVYNVRQEVARQLRFVAARLEQEKGHVMQYSQNVSPDQDQNMVLIMDFKVVIYPKDGEGRRRSSA